MVVRLVLARVEESVTIFSYLSGMYGWVLDGISSLFEPVTGPKPAELTSRSHVSGEDPTPPGWKAGAQAQENQGRPAKRNYQSVDVADGVCNGDQVEVKRRKRDVVISFVKKTVAGVAGLLRLRNPLKTRCEKARLYEESQPITLMGIDELHTSWLTSTEWSMSKPVIRANEWGGKNCFQSSPPPSIRKYSLTALPAGLADRGREMDKTSSFPPLPSRPAPRLAAAHSYPTSSSFGHSRFFKPNLTVEEAIKQNNKEHYRRLLEMVTEKYSKNQPLPFNQTRPQNESVCDLRTPPSQKTIESVPKKMGCTAAPSVFTWRTASTTKDRRSSLPFCMTTSKAIDGADPAKCTKQKPAAELDLSTEVATRLKLVDQETPAFVPPETHSFDTVHQRYSGEDIPRLTKEMVAEVSCALCQSDPNLVLSAAFKLRITQRDLATLQEGGWLNDEVMNFYLSLVMERSFGEAAGLKVYSFSTFFFPKLCGGGGAHVQGHAAVKRWTKAVDLFLYDLIMVPLHLGVHWALAVIDLKSKTVKSYDSMGQRHDDICGLLLRYLKDEHKAKKGVELDGTKWTIGSSRASEIPQQKNGSDCGVFTCKYADYIAKGRPLTFKQCHMPLFRKLMIWEILNQKLL